MSETAIPQYATPHAARLAAWNQYANKVRSQGINSDLLSALLTYSAAGFGAGLTGTRLYQLASDMNKPSNKYTKFGPGAKTVDDAEKLAADAPSTPSTLEQLTSTIAAIPGQLASKIPAPPDLNQLNAREKGWVVPALLGTTGLSIYGGHKLMSAIYDQKRKEEREEAVEEARKEYQRALTGKRAEALDTAFDAYTEKRGVLGALQTGYDILTAPVAAAGLLPAYQTAVLGTGALAGKMTYDWTRERSKDKALERARKSRARLAGVSPMYVDPDQIAAIAELAKKKKMTDNEI